MATSSRDRFHSSDALRSRLTPAAGVHNPVDLIGSTDPLHFRHCLAHLRGTSEGDAVVLLYVPRLPATSAVVCRELHAAARRDAGKPYLAVLMESAEPPRELADSTLQVPSFRFPGGLMPRARKNCWPLVLKAVSPVMLIGEPGDWGRADHTLPREAAMRTRCAGEGARVASGLRALRTGGLRGGR